ncbi:MAG: LSM domain-containing protein [Thermoproteota archaeon]|jgi:small nuclear ribonucleoprotein (snRNP)-like protein|nr:LSM domain-containing protein [Thermoproteota archaeon]
MPSKITSTEEQITPLKLMFRCVKDTVTVWLKDHTILRGILYLADPNMNLILTDAEEINENGEVKIKYGKVFIRGNNILYISVPPSQAIFK